MQINYLDKERLQYFFNGLKGVIDNIVTDKILEDNKKKNPIGKIIFSTENVNPAEYLGFGTWEAWGSGRVPVGVDTGDSNFDTPEKEGGEQTHSLTVNEMPSHGHDYSTTTGSNGSHQHSFSATSGSNGSHQHSFSATTGSSGTHQHTGKRLESGVNTSSSSAVNDLVRPDGMSGTKCNVGNSTGAHTHSVSGNTSNTGAHTHSVSGDTSNTGAHTHTVSGITEDMGGDQAHNNLQPYITCYMWERIA